MSINPLAMLLLMGALTATLAGCGRGAPDPTPQSSSTSEEPPPSNRVAVPPAVRTNLGITFAKVERRRVEQTLRMPGRFELQPTAVRQYHALLPGQVELLVDQFDTVQAGDPLLRIVSPAWFEHQRDLSEAYAGVEKLVAQLAGFDAKHAAHRDHAQRAERAIAIRQERVEQLEGIAASGGGRRQELIDARDALASAQSELAEVHETDAMLESERAVALAELAAARGRVALLLRAASAMHGEPIASLTEIDGEHPRWRSLDALTVRARSAGVVESIDVTDGAWASQDAAILRVVRPDRLRFRASALQSDLGVLRDGLPARIVPPTATYAGRAVALDQSMAGAVRLGLDANADDRTIELFVTPEEILPWARRGVSAQLEIVTDATATPVLAIPLAAVQRDGLTPVIFIRDRDNPGQVVRTEADLGMDDGRWIVIRSGVREGDEVVLDGAFQLMLATSGATQKGGHFHADGTFHEGEE